MQIRSWYKFLLSTILVLGLTIFPVNAAQTEVVKLVDGESGYQIVVPNFIDVSEVEVDGETVMAVIAEKPTQNKNGSYTFFEIKTSDEDAKMIYSFPRINYEQIGDFVADIENGSLIYSPFIYKDFEKLSQENVFSFNFSVFNEDNEEINNFTNIYFKFVEGETTPTVPVETTPVPVQEVTANPTASKVAVDGKDISFEAYNIDGYNYFRLRDMAMAITGSEKQFEVTWDGEKNAINLVSGGYYTSVGGELTISSKTDSIKAVTNQSKIYVDGEEIALQAYTIDGNNYFKLRDVAEVFDFGVTWNEVLNQIVIDTTIGYTAQ